MDPLVDPEVDIPVQSSTNCWNLATPQQRFVEPGHKTRSAQVLGVIPQPKHGANRQGIQQPHITQNENAAIQMKQTIFHEATHQAQIRKDRPNAARMRFFSLAPRYMSSIVTRTSLNPTTILDSGCQMSSRKIDHGLQY